MLFVFIISVDNSNSLSWLVVLASWIVLKPSTFGRSNLPSAIHRSRSGICIGCIRKDVTAIDVRSLDSTTTHCSLSTYWRVGRRLFPNLKRIFILFRNIIRLRVWNNFFNLLNRHQGPSFNKTLFSWLSKAVVPHDQLFRTHRTQRCQSRIGAIGRDISLSIHVRRVFQGRGRPRSPNDSQVRSQTKLCERSILDEQTYESFAPSLQLQEQILVIHVCWFSMIPSNASMVSFCSQTFFSRRSRHFKTNRISTLISLMSLR